MPGIREGGQHEFFRGRGRQLRGRGEGGFLDQAGVDVGARGNGQGSLWIRGGGPARAFEFNPLEGVALPQL